MSKWERVKLEDVCREITVGHVGPMADKYIEKGIPFLRSLSVEPFRIKREGMKFIDGDFHAKLKKSALRPGDVVIVRTGKPGACAVIPEWLENANCSDLVVARCGPRLRPRFLCYVINSVASQHIDNHLVGAVQQHFNVGSARILEFGLPDLEGQDAILALLGSIDDKIELNHQMNETLEAMARAVFRDWFVDFGPTRAKMEGRAPYLAPEIWALFPDRLDDQGKPEGWEVRTLNELSSELRRGLSPSYVEDDGIPVLNQKCIRDSRVDFLKARRHDPNKKAIEGRTLRIGDVLVNSTGVGTLGRVAQIWHFEEPTIVDSHVTVVRSHTQFNRYVLGQSLIGRELEIESLGHGSTGQTELSRERLGQLNLIVADNNVHSLFEELVKPLKDRTVANELESRSLAQSRDLLLPKLMSGEIRIRDVEREVEQKL